MELRQYQKIGVAAVRQAVVDGAKAPLIVLPTGGGKSVIMADIISRAVQKGKSILWLVHRRGLVIQMRDTLNTMGILDVGIIMAGYEPNIEAKVQVGTVQTYARRIDSKKEDQFNPNFHQADIIMVDEAHRTVTTQYQHILGRYPYAIKIGCTATPLRGDGRGLGDVYDALIEIATVKDLTDEGYLSPARYFAPTTIVTDDLPVARGDFLLNALSERVRETSITGDVVTNWLNCGEDRKTLVFAVDVRHSKAIRDEFRKQGISCEHLDAHSSDDLRDGVFRSMERGDTKVITNVAVYQEGLDVPDISCIVMARPTKSLGLWKQCCGRGLRVSPGKEDCLIFDHGGCIDRLGFLDETVYWTLDAQVRGYTKPKPREADPKKMTCRECGQIFQGQSNCPVCGTPLKSWGRHVQTYEAELKEIDTKERKKVNREMSWEEKIDIYAGLKYYSIKNGWHKGRKAHLYRLMTSVWPNDPRLSRCEPKKPEGQTFNHIKYLLMKSRAIYNKGGRS